MLLGLDLGPQPFAFTATHHVRSSPSNETVLVIVSLSPSTESAYSDALASFGMRVHFVTSTANESFTAPELGIPVLGEH